jgi:hypothetical protein
MSSGFNLTAQLQLQAPTNTKQVAGQIQSGLGNITIPVQIQADPKALGGLNNQLKTTQKTALATGKNMAFLNRNIAEAARRFSVITVATGSFIALARGIKNSVKAAVEFERELIKISQVTGKNVSQLRGLTSEVTNLSTGLGVANQSLLETARVLSQAGLSATKTKQAMEVLANTTLAPSFDNIIDTTEGAIAILNQFGREAKKTGQDIKFLEQSLDAINQVSKNFAVESADLITAIRRTGGVFEAAGGSLNELIALFTSVRQTTRESAETIATGFRTIFTRLQRSETVDALNELGIALTDAEGKFIGPLKAIEALSIGLAGLDPKDIRFNEIVEQLGGFRQIGKVIPLIKQYSVAQQALSIANNAAGSTAEDAQSAQKSLAVQFQKVTEQFDALIRKFSDSETFRGLAKTVIDLATAFLKFAESLENVLPQLVALAAIKIGRNIAPGILGLIGGGGGVKKNMGGRIHGYAQGGWVPGTGSRDTVPAMLTPGEFVIKKSSAAKLGSDTLSGMNAKGYASGGKVSSFRNAYGPKSPRVGSFDKPAAGQIAPGGDTQFATVSDKAGDARNAVLQVVRAGDKRPNNAVDAGGAFLQPIGIERNLRADIPGKDLKADLKAKIVSKYKGSGTAAEDKSYINKAVDALPASSLDIPVMVQSGGFSKTASDTFKSEIAKGIGDGAAKSVPEAMTGKFNRGKFDTALQSANIEQIEGNIFESFLAGLSDKPYDNAKINANDNWDFASGVGSGLGGLFGISGDVAADAKRTFSDDSISSIVKKAGTQFKEQQGDKLARELSLALKPPKQKDNKDRSRTKITKAQKQAADRKNMGGSISGSGDSVPALLTPGEFVVKKSAAQSIGYSNLSSMNKTGIAKFNKGGPVGIQTFADGGNVLESGDFGVTKAKDLALVNAAAKRNAAAFDAITAELNNMNLDPEAQRAALVKFSRSVDSAATEAELLQQAIDAAHSDITSSGDGADRTGKKEKGTGGETEARSAPVFSGDEMAELANVSDHLAKEFENTIGETRAGQKAQMAYRKAVSEGIPNVTAMNMARAAGKKYEEELSAESEALAQARLDGTMSAEDLTRAELDLMKRTQAASKGRKSKPGGGNKGGGGPTPADLKASSQAYSEAAQAASSSAQKLNGVATAAIGLSFVAGTMIETFGSLNEEEKKRLQAATNAFAAHVALAAQIGSLVLEVISSILASKANSLAKKAEAGAASTASGALLKVAASATAASAAMDGKTATEGVSDIDVDVDPAGGKGGKFAKGIGPAVASLTAGFAAVTVVTGLMAAATAYAVEGLKQMAAKANELGDQELEKIGQVGGEVANEDEFVAQRGAAVSADIEAELTQSVGAFNQSAVAWGGAIGVAAAATASVLAATGVAFQAIPVIGTIAGAALLAVAAALAGMAIAFAFFTKSYEEEQKKIKNAMELAMSASEGFARTTFRAQSAMAGFDASLKQAEENGLSAAQQLGVLATGITKLETTYTEGSSRVAKATKDRIAAEKELVDLGVLTEGGEETGRTDFDDETKDAAKDAIARTKELRDQEAEARKSQNDLLGKLMQQESAIRGRMMGAISETVNKLNKGSLAGLEGFTGIDSLQALAQEAGPVGQAFKELNVNLEIAKARFKDIVDRRFDERISAAEGDNDALAISLAAEKAAVLAQQEAELAKQTADLAVAINRARVEQLNEAIIRREQNKIIAQNNNAMKGFNDLLTGTIGTTAKSFAEIDDALGGLEFSAPQIDSSALDQPLSEISDKLLSNTLGRTGVNQGGVDNFDADPFTSRIKQAKGLIDLLPGIIKDFNKTVEDKTQDAFEGLDQKTGKIFGNIAAAMNTSAEELGKTNLGKILKTKILTMVDEAGVNPINADAIQEVIDDLEQEVGADIETIKKNIEIQNMFLEKMNKVNQAVVVQQQAFAEATARVVDVQERAADRMAQATGNRRDRGDKERGRLKAANIRLGGAKTDFGAKAGNVNKTFDAAKLARDEARQQRENAKTEANKVGASPDLDKIDEFDKAAGQAGQAFKNAKAELERMANQSARAGDIMAEIAEEQKKRGQLKQIGENIAFGSDDQRKDIARGFNDLQMAVAQGGIQNANDGERARILKTLDSVADVEVGNTGKTGKELKAQFQADEIMRLTGNQDLAQASFDQAMLGSKEDQLLKELQAVGKEEAKAAAKLAELEEKEVNYLENIAATLQAAFGKDLAASQAANTPPVDPNEAQEDADLETKRDEATGTLDTALENQRKATETLTASTDSLAKIMLLRQITESPETAGAAMNAAGFSDEERLGFANDFIQGLKDQYAGQTMSDGTDKLKVAADGDISNLNDENRSTYQAILGDPLRQRVEAEARGDSGGSQMRAREKLEEEERKKREEAQNAARGGLIYRSVGGSIFKPKGTDTVPAMLTPGEFVIRKAAVDRIGMSALTAMNSGDASAVYKATGGGVGYNKSLNRNRIAGFRRGGMVGGQGTSYANSQGNGAVLQIDPSSIQSVLNEFNANFGNHIDNMIANLGTFAEAATSLATTITNGMDVRIVMSGDLATAVRLDGDQTEHLKNAIADSILPQIAENVAGTIEDKIRQLKDNP